MHSSLFSRPNKPLTCKNFDFNIKNPLLDSPKLVSPTKLLTVDSSTECHTTPDQVGNFMVACLDYQEGLTILEPHVGTGQLIGALLRENICINSIKAYELNNSLCNFTKNRFPDLSIEQGDFLEIKNQSFHRVIANPPFKTIIKHMDHIYKCLKVGGIAICLVPITYKKIDHEIIEILPDDTFSTCKVNTKIIKIIK